MARKRTRYKSEEHIVRLIDKQLEAQLRNAQSCEQMENESRELKRKWTNVDAATVLTFKEDDEWRKDIYRATMLQREADRLRQYQGVYANRLKRLKATLAAFQTMPMPFVDESVVLQ